MDDRPEIHARATDPDTSHAAVPFNITEQALRVLWAYAHGDQLIDHDAYQLVGLDNGERFAHQRCSDLRRWDMIVRTGERGVTPSGKWGYLCCITPAGIDFLASQLMGPEPEL